MKIPGLGFILFSPLSDTFGDAVEMLMFVGRVPPTLYRNLSIYM